jgi:hypothetical protein
MNSPATQGYEIIEAIKARLEKGPLREFDFALFESQAEKLKHAEPHMAFSVLGALACLRLDEKLCREHHQKSIALAPGMSLMLHNYSVSLASLGLWEEAMLYMRRAVEIDPLDLLHRKVMVRLAYSSGDESALRHALEEWHRVSGGERHFVEDYLLEDANDASLVDDARIEMADTGPVPWAKIKHELNL